MVFQTYKLTPWHIETGTSIPKSQELFSNCYPEPNQTNSSCWQLFLQNLLKYYLTIYAYVLQEVSSL